MDTNITDILQQTIGYPHGKPTQYLLLNIFECDVRRSGADNLSESNGIVLEEAFKIKYPLLKAVFQDIQS